MKQRRIDLARRRQRLQLRSAEQRAAFAHHAAGLAPAFTAVDAVRQSMVTLREHPEWLIGAAALFLIVRPRAIYRWARRAFVIWRAIRAVREWLAKPSSLPL